MQNKNHLVKIIFGFLLSWCLIHTLYIIYDGLYDKKQNADVAIILGNKVNKDGTLSDRLKQRLNQGIKLYHLNRVKKIIVSGGYGKEGFWEANKMKEYLLVHKISNENIIVDNNGNNTEKTVENTIKIMDSLHLKSAISVSQYYHQTRIKKLFKKNSFVHIESSSPTYFELRDVYSIFREFIAYYKEAI